VFAFRILKEIKKRLKRKRRPVWSLGMLAALFALASAAGIAAAVAIERSAFGSFPAAPVSAWESVPGQPDKPSAPDPSAATRDLTLQALARWRGEVEVVLHRDYWCGEETRMLGRLSTTEAAELVKSHRDWDAAFDRTGRVVLEELVEDISPACRENAYIGMDQDGNLSLFDGPPRKDNVVRTFFQLDVRSLESSLSKEKLHELAGGIRVTDKDEYTSVLSTYSDYAMHKSRGVMKPEK
jgi:forespore regulator of the sigma-K checkpoint